MTEWGYYGPRTPYRGMVDELANQTSGYLAVDIESVSLDDDTPLCISFSNNSHEAYYFPWDSPLLPWHLLSNTGVWKIFQNGHFDLAIIEKYKGITTTPVVDTMIAAQLMGLQPSLYSLAQVLFGVTLTTIEDLLGKKGKNQLTMLAISEETVAKKCTQDTKFTYRTWETLHPFIPWAAFIREMEYMPVLKDMQNRGMRVDLDALEEHRVRIRKDVDYYEGIAQGMGFNPGSSQQVAAVLQSRGHFITYNRVTKNPKLNKDMLRKYYADDFVTQLVLLYREGKILLSTFIEAIPAKYLQGDRVFGKINQLATNSGRTSRSAPNLQNQPEEIRNIWIASEGCTLEDWDLNQIEMRILAWYIAMWTGDYTMWDVYRQNQVHLSDIHQATQDKVEAILGRHLGKTDASRRRIAKNINFSSVYLGDEDTLNRRYGIPLDEAIAFQAAYHAAYPGFRVLVEMVKQFLHTNGYTETYLGRRRWFLDKLNSGNEYLIAAALREALNHIIQGTAAEIQKLLQIRAKDYPQINTVHDSTQFDRPHGMIIPRDMAEDLAPYRTPMEVKEGNNWRDEVKVGVFG